MANLSLILILLAGLPGQTARLVHPVPAGITDALAAKVAGHVDLDQGVPRGILARQAHVKLRPLGKHVPSVQHGSWEEILFEEVKVSNTKNMVIYSSLQLI